MSRIQNGEFLVTVGPRGDLYNKCEEWDEVTFGTLKQILISHGNAINSIQMAYDYNGNLVLSHRRGGDGNKFDCISFESWESLTVISGHYGPVTSGGSIAIKSLTFVTNRATYGPFGEEAGGSNSTPFCFNFQSGVSFAGFHGRSTTGFLRAIGVYIKTNVKYHVKPDPPRYRTAPALCGPTS